MTTLVITEELIAWAREAGACEEGLAEALAQVGEPYTVLSVDYRIWVAQRIEAKYLPAMRKDPDWDVRYAVALRIDVKYLSAMRKDPYWVVRSAVAQRIENGRMQV